MRFVLLKADDSISFLEIPPSKRALEILQGVVKGLIEIVYCQEDQILIVNEDGRSLGLPVNKAATELLGSKVLGGIGRFSEGGRFGNLVYPLRKTMFHGPLSVY